MGACAAVFYMSDKFRKMMKEAIQLKHNIDVNWAPRRVINSVILDSPFANLKRSIKFMLGSRLKNVPDFFVDMVFGMLKNSIQKKMDVDIDAINPEEYA